MLLHLSDAITRGDGLSAPKLEAIEMGWATFQIMRSEMMNDVESRYGKSILGNANS
jgi:hypothetical protein